MDLKQNISTSYERHSHVLQFFRVKFNPNWRVKFNSIAFEICRFLKISAAIREQSRAEPNIWSHFYWFIRINSNIDKLFMVFFRFLFLSKFQKMTKNGSNFRSIVQMLFLFFPKISSFDFEWRFFFAKIQSWKSCLFTAHIDLSSVPWASFFLCRSVWIHLRNVCVETSRCVAMDTYRTRGYRISSFSVSGWQKKRWKRDRL